MSTFSIIFIVLLVVIVALFIIWAFSGSTVTVVQIPTSLLTFKTGANGSGNIFVFDPALTAPLVLVPTSGPTVTYPIGTTTTGPASGLAANMTYTAVSGGGFVLDKFTGDATSMSGGTYTCSTVIRTPPTGVFTGCTTLKTLILPLGFASNNLITDMSYMFSGCTALETLVLPSGFGSSTGLTSIVSMFQGCSALINLALPFGFGGAAGITSGANMFNGCIALTNLTLPTSFLSKDLATVTTMFTGILQANITIHARAHTNVNPVGFKFLAGGLTIAPTALTTKINAPPGTIITSAPWSTYTAQSYLVGTD